MAFLSGIEAPGHNMTLYHVAMTVLMIWMAFLASALAYLLVFV
jgi:hypothetical protein